MKYDEKQEAFFRVQVPRILQNNVQMERLKLDEEGIKLFCRTPHNKGYYSTE